MNLERRDLASFKRDSDKPEWPASHANAYEHALNMISETLGSCQVSRVEMACVCFNISILVYFFTFYRIYAQTFYYSIFHAYIKELFGVFSLFGCRTVHFGLEL